MQENGVIGLIVLQTAELVGLTLESLQIGDIGAIQTDTVEQCMN